MTLEKTHTKNFFFECQSECNPKKLIFTTRPTCGPLLILPPLRSVGDPSGGRGYVATRPTCGPLLIVSPALKRWGPPRLQGLCSRPSHLWATSDCFPRSEVLGTPRFQALGTPQAAGVM